MRKLPQPPQLPKNASEVYLFLYNSVQTIGWTAILVRLILHFLQGRDYTTAWDSTGLLLRGFQYAAVLEIIHPLLKLVRTPISTTFIQVFSRVFLTFICASFFEARSSWAYSTMVASWAVTEIVRYSYYALNIFSVAPYYLLWLRYTLFYILYPTGAGSEVLVLIASLPLFRDTGLWSISLPNALNFSFSFYIALWVLILLYIPGLPKMYTHMISQRRRILNAPPLKQE